MKDYFVYSLVIVQLALIVALVAKAVSTASPESATDEKPTLENRIDR